MPTTLTQQLADYKAGFIQRVAPDRVAMMEGATADLRATGIEGSALQVGDQAPDITLTDAQGHPVRLPDLWQQGPLVLIFYRGGWCPYCNLELRAWQQRLSELATLGARLVAVSPQTPDNSMSTAEKNELAYPVLSDSSLTAANGFGIAFQMPQSLIDLYSQVGNDLPVLNGNGQWVLPLPATYVIGRDGCIAFAHIEADYRERAEPADILMQLQKLDGGNRRSMATPHRSDRAASNQLNVGGVVGRDHTGVFHCPIRAQAVPRSPIISGPLSGPPDAQKRLRD